MKISRRESFGPILALLSAPHWIRGLLDISLVRSGRITPEEWLRQFYGNLIYCDEPGDIERFTALISEHDIDGQGSAFARIFPSSRTQYTIEDFVRELADPPHRDYASAIFITPHFFNGQYNGRFFHESNTEAISLLGHERYHVRHLKRHLERDKDEVLAPAGLQEKKRAPLVVHRARRIPAADR